LVRGLDIGDALISNLPLEFLSIRVSAPHLKERLVSKLTL
jgi:hypothetical protein